MPVGEVFLILGTAFATLLICVAFVAFAVAAKR